jgi:homospermidine synthase
VTAKVNYRAGRLYSYHASLDGIKLILENFGKEYSDAPRSQKIHRRLAHRAAQAGAVRGKLEAVT